MTNPFYVASGTPATSSFGASQPMRSEFQAIQGGFEKFPDFTGSAPGTFLINNFTATGITTAPGMLIDPAGNIGIGTPTPAHPVDITRNQTSGTSTRISNNDPVGNSSIILSNGTNVTSLAMTGTAYAIANNFSPPNATYLYGDGAGGLNFVASHATAAIKFFNGVGAGTERMRIDGTGKVGINTPSPVTMLHVYAVAGQTAGLLRVESASDSVNPVLELRDSTTAQARANSINFLNDAGSAIGAIAYGSRNSTIPNCLVFITNTVERMRIDSGGIVTIPGQLSANGPFTVGAVGVPGSIFFKRDSDGVIQSRIAESASNIGLYFETTSGGAFSFFTSGAGFGSNAERMRIDASGNVGIGMAPANVLDIRRDQAAVTMAQLSNANAAGYVAWQLQNNSSTAGLHYYGTGFATSGQQRADGVLLWGAGAGGLGLTTFNASPIIFATQGGERMRIDAAGNVGIGTVTPQAILDITRSVNGSNHTLLLNTDAGNNGVAQHIVGNGTHSAALAFFSANGTSLASPLWHADGSSLYAGGNGGLSVCTRVAAPLYFGTNDIERMRIDLNGFVGIGTTGPWGSEKLGTNQPGPGAYNVIHLNSNPAPSGALMQRWIFWAAAPNNTGAYFQYMDDTASSRAYFWANGGLANFSANNANISDEGVKDYITPYSDVELARLETSFTSVIWGKYKYRDQTHDDWNHGPTAQGIERAFADTAPELVDVAKLGPKAADGSPGKNKVVYETDLNHIAHALLAKVMKDVAMLKTYLPRA